MKICNFEIFETLKSLNLLILFSHSDQKAQPWGGPKADISGAFRLTLRGCGGRAPAYYYFNKKSPYCPPAFVLDSAPTMVWDPCGGQKGSGIQGSPLGVFGVQGNPWDRLLVKSSYPFCHQMVSRLECFLLHCFHGGWVGCVGYGCYASVLAQAPLVVLKVLKVRRIAVGLKAIPKVCDMDTQDPSF